MSISSTMSLEEFFSDNIPTILSSPKKEGKQEDIKITISRLQEELTLLRETSKTIAIQIKNASDIIHQLHESLQT